MHLMNKNTRSFVQAFTSVASDNYPESVYKTYMVNAPFVFRSAWAIVSQWLDPNTVAKFKILGGEKEYMPKLLEWLDDEDIPAFLGGKDTSCDFIDERGSWAEHMPTTRGPWID